LLKNENDDDLSFLDDDKTVDKVTQLRFDILKDIYITKKQETEDFRKSNEDKANKQKILELIQRKKDSQLENLSLEELEKLANA
jgi:hypothetical protein